MTMKIKIMNIIVIMMLMVVVSLKVLSQVRIRVKPVIVTSPEEVATTFFLLQTLKGWVGEFATNFFATTFSIKL